MKDLAPFSAKEMKTAAAEEREKRDYSSSKGQCELIFVAKSSQQAFWKLKEDGDSLGWESGKRETARRTGR